MRSWPIVCSIGHVPFAKATAMSKRFTVRLAAIAALLLVPAAALGYGILVHNLVVTKGIADQRSLSNTPVKNTTLTGVRTADFDRFRRWFYDQARALPDTAIRNGFTRRYPTAAAFDARAFKEFLMMNGGASVLGFDSMPAV